MKTDFQVYMKILKPASEVYEAIVDPKKLSVYFIGKSSGRMQEGSTVYWNFTEHPGDVPIEVTKLVPNELIRFNWNGDDFTYKTQVEITLKAIAADITLISISETGWKQDDKGTKSSYRNCGGWMNMICCLKAYIEYGINLRKGAFEGLSFE